MDLVEDEGKKRKILTAKRRLGTNKGTIIKYLLKPSYVEAMDMETGPEVVGTDESVGGRQKLWKTRKGSKDGTNDTKLTRKLKANGKKKAKFVKHSLHNLVSSYFFGELM